MRGGNVHVDLGSFWEVLWELGIHNPRQDSHKESGRDRAVIAVISYKIQHGRRTYGLFMLKVSKVKPRKASWWQKQVQRPSVVFLPLGAGEGTSGNRYIHLSLVKSPD